MNNPNLPANLRRAADFLEAVVIKKHIAFVRWTPWYIEAIREAADKLENFDRAFTEDALLRMTGQYLGTTPERLRELAREEQEGRLVVLPCKVGDLVYISGHKYVAQIDEVTINAMDGITLNWSEYDRGPELTELWDDGWFTPDDIGKTVFLTREEADAALKGDSNDDNS